MGSLPLEHEALHTNLELEQHSDVTIFNARPRKERFSLDIDGFEFISFEPKVQILHNEDVSEYLLGVATFLKKHFQTPHVFPYDLRVSHCLPQDRKMLIKFPPRCDHPVAVRQARQISGTKQLMS